MLQQRQLSLGDFVHGYEHSISAVQLAVDTMGQYGYHQTVKLGMVKVSHILREGERQNEG